MELTRDLLERAFDMMGDLAAQDGKVIEIAVYGGSCLLLASNIRDVTRDVDAVFLADPKTGYALADEVGRRLGLPRAWLNQAVKRLAPPKGNPEPNLMPYGEYPRRGAVGLRIFLPSPEYMLAMKLLANRLDDPEGEARDRRDIHLLMGITGLTDGRRLADLVKVCYPVVPNISVRMQAKIDDIVSGYVHDDKPEQPTWNAPRGRPTR